MSSMGRYSALSARIKGNGTWIAIIGVILFFGAGGFLFALNGDRIGSTTILMGGLILVALMYFSRDKPRKITKKEAQQETK